MKNLDFFIKPLKRTFDFKGRANRKEFWLYFVVLLGAFYAACFLIMGLTIASCALMYDDMGAQEGCGWIGTAICILLFWLGFPFMLMSVGARRLHDSDKSGWWQLLIFIPSLGILALFILMLLSGTEGDNRYGPPPQA